ncbi:COG2958 family protein [Enterovibrio norvegicus]|uniref:COG2958 family protein n=1 Tax=Enterovibrio norvegicus TaxID=188144 RepID=UPI0013D37162|nr:HrgA protein [Enterovibrio norvegicus]
MAKLSQTQKIAQFLKQYPDQRFSARDIAQAIILAYPEDYADKRANPRFADDKAFVSQVVAEIGAQKGQIISISDQIKWQDKPRPRVYWYETEGSEPEDNEDVEENASSDIGVLASRESVNEPLSAQTLSEAELYPVLVDYLRSEHQLNCMRIDEKRSKNSRGNGGNQWLHPDIVAMEAVAEGWHKHVKTCVHAGGGQSVRLWSFEVKKELTMGNVRKCFFQAVSNSSWANEGYLVATSIADSKVEQELRMLSALHGIGLILLSIENPSESELLLPALKRAQIDWQSVNRIVEENKDFSHFIDLASDYYRIGRLKTSDWD